MPDRIQPARDIKNGQLFITTVGEGGVICIRLKGFWDDWRVGLNGKSQYRDCGPYTLAADHESWNYALDGVTEVSGFASSLAEAKMKCMESVLLAVLGCLEFTD